MNNRSRVYVCTWKKGERKTEPNGRTLDGKGGGCGRLEGGGGIRERMGATARFDFAADSFGITVQIIIPLSFTSIDMSLRIYILPRL